MEQPVIVMESRQQALARVVGCGAFVAGSAWAMLYGRGDVFGYFILTIAIVFFGIGALRFAWSVVAPGQLTISTTGFEQALGWRRRLWNWRDIFEVRVESGAAGLISYCTIYPKVGSPVKLYGWELSGRELKGVIDRLHPTGTCS